MNPSRPRELKGAPRELKGAIYIHICIYIYMYICAKGEGGLDMYIQTWHNEFELVLRGLNGGRVMPGRDLARPRSRSGPGLQNEFELVLRTRA